MHYRRTRFIPSDIGWNLEELRLFERGKRGLVNPNVASTLRWYKRQAARASRREAQRDIAEQLREEDPMLIP